MNARLMALIGHPLLYILGLRVLQVQRSQSPESMLDVSRLPRWPSWVLSSLFVWWLKWVAGRLSSVAHLGRLNPAMVAGQQIQPLSELRRQDKVARDSCLHFLHGLLLPRKLNLLC
jgi:hypothetical protein